MTLDKLQENVCKLLENSNVNLGRKKTRTRQNLIALITNQFIDFASTNICNPIVEEKGEEKEKNSSGENDRLICLKPQDPTAALSAGKGAFAMTSTQSMEADKQLGRSPYAKGEKNEQNNK